MARIRTIKPGFFKDGDLFDAEERTKLPLRMAFAGLWTVADREGRFKWKPRDIKPDILPFDNVNMAEVLNALVDCGKIQKYTVDGIEYGWIPGFLAHQHINQREAASEIPAPPQNKNARAKRVRAPDESVGKGKEGKGKEGESADADDPQFEAFWQACPKKVDRPAAEKAWPKALKIASAETIIAGMVRYAATQVGKTGDERHYIKTPGPWLNGKRWEDEVSAPSGQATIHVLSDEIRAREQENLKKMGLA